MAKINIALIDNKPKERSMNEEMLHCLSKAIGYYQEYFNRSFGSRKAMHYKRGHYPFIPYNGICYLVTTLVNIRKRLEKAHQGSTDRFRLLDAGCGIGNIVLIADLLGFSAEGIEYDKKYISVGHNLLCSYKSPIIHGDITKFAHYDQYDVIYCFVPMDSRYLLDKFTQRVIKDAKIGAYIIPIACATPFSRDKRFRGLKLGQRRDGCRHTIYQKQRL